MSETVHYAIGDVHGEAEKLARLHDCIREDAARLGVAPHFVHLGDLVDRGPDSRAVIESVMQLDGEGVCLRGNHEAMMLNAYSGESGLAEHSWATNGGMQTVESYNRANGETDHWRAAVDRNHIHWLRGLPSMWRDGRLVFVHAGIDPYRFPDCVEEVRLWTRSRIFLNSEAWPQREALEDVLVVHGHTPTDDFEPERQRRRVNVDTGACFGGPLTCAVLAPDEKPRFLHAR